MPPLFRPRPRSALNPAHRAFSTTPPRPFTLSPSLPISLQLHRNDPTTVADTVPAYPYGPARWYKQSDLGLYGGRKLRFGNNVGPEFGVKTRRNWRPNIQNKRLWSRALNTPVQVRVSTRVLRTIDTVGGLDEYLLGEKEARIKELGMSGWWLRWAIMQTPAIKRRFAEERKRLGVPVEQADGGLREADDASAVISEASEAEVEAATEPVRMDGAFEVEAQEGTPALKFRVGRGRHVILTAEGWRRTRPTRPWQEQVKLEALVEGNRELLKEKQGKIIQSALAGAGATLGGREKAKSIRVVQKEITALARVKAEEQMERGKESARRRRAVRKQNRKEAAKAELSIS